MKLIHDPRFAAPVMAELHADPRTRPMLAHYRELAQGEAAGCAAEDSAAYAELLRRFDDVMGVSG